MTKMMELVDKDLNIVIINMFKNLKKNINIMRKEMEDMKNNQTQLLETKTQ